MSVSHACPAIHPTVLPHVMRCLNILHFGIVRGTACLASPVKFAVLSCVHPSCHLLTVDTSGLCMFSLVYAPLVDFSVGKKVCGRTEPKGAVTRQGCACLPAALGGLCQATFCSLPPSQTALCTVPLALAGWLAGLLPVSSCLPGFRELRGMASAWAEPCGKPTLAQLPRPHHPCSRSGRPQALYPTPYLVVGPAWTLQVP